MPTQPYDRSEEESDRNHEHNHHHHDVEDPGVAVLTVSSSRSVDDDPSGDAIETALNDADYRVVERESVGDDYDAIRSRVESYTTDERVDAVVTTGGTGVTPDDVTVEAVSSLFTKDLPGFGELFRRRSADEIGTRVIGTRATAGVVAEMPVFCLPGSENAAQLGVSEIIISELPHLIGLAQR
ncbi:MogA/MoaB family molybdenum cofactor biosynthesis protein [Halocatena salina]|uniref:Molybdopterin-binding protein n=1 Tax=Halocatena salina TaxID=2934340 RepID=A0A8U0A3H3_9EURY|nr:molybdenum cofactor synthesis domain-containing protein [Halocatena salina]UPM43396.1 molybdopterin-binding protein [Halocatena salina]